MIIRMITTQVQKKIEQVTPFKTEEEEEARD